MDITLIGQVAKLYSLGQTVERRRRALRRLAERGVPYDSPQMRAALEAFQAAQREWNTLEQEHLDARSRFQSKT